MLSDALRAMTEHQHNKARLYVTDSDITSLPCFANDTIFAVRAPQGTTLEVPDPEADGRGQRKYRWGAAQRLRLHASKWCWCCVHVVLLVA